MNKQTCKPAQFPPSPPRAPQIPTNSLRFLTAAHWQATALRCAALRCKKRKGGGRRVKEGEEEKKGPKGMGKRESTKRLIETRFYAIVMRHTADTSREREKHRAPHTTHRAPHTTHHTPHSAHPCSQRSVNSFVLCLLAGYPPPPPQSRQPSFSL